MPKPKKCLKSPTFNIPTSQEAEAFGHAAADGRLGLNYQNVEYPEERIHRRPGASHYVRLELEAGEQGIEAIEELTREQDADSHLAILYIAHLLAPPFQEPLAHENCWVSFDDVIDKIGWVPRSTEERREMHRRIYSIIRFGARARVIGERSIPYVEPGTKKKIDTRIESSLWQIHEVERPQELEIFDETPVRAQLIITPRWVPFLSSGQLAQFLPFGDKLGAISANKTSGAWARVIGLSLASFWRRNRKRVLDGTIRPTRRELLESYPPKTGSVQEIFDSINPGYAVNHWHTAIGLLVKAGFIENSGEALLTAADTRARLPRKDWTQLWLSEEVEIEPNAETKAVLEQVALSAPARSRRALR